MKNLNYKFKNENLLKRAFVHSSKSEQNYERLEYLGDSILDFITSEYFYLNCQDNEGKLSVIRSHFVSENYLSKLFDKLELTSLVQMGKSFQGELTKSIKGDVIEALIAALYLDGGMEVAKNFIYQNFDLQNYKNIIDDNYKSKLQELIQGNFKCKMKYETYADKEGFISEFYMDEDKISLGKGKSKQEAEQMAAKEAIDKLFLVN